MGIVMFLKIRYLINKLVKSYLVDDDDHDKAQKALVKMGSQAVEPLIEALNDRRKSEIWTSVRQCLTDIGEASVQPLIRAMQIPNWKESYGFEKIISTLGSIGDKRAVNPLIELYGVLGELNDREREYVLQSLAEIGGETALEYCSKLIESGLSGFKKERISMGLSFSWKGEEQALDIIKKLLEDNNHEVREKVAVTFSEPDGVSYLVHVSTGNDEIEQRIKIIKE